MLAYSRIFFPPYKVLCIVELKEYIYRIVSGSDESLLMMLLGVFDDLLNPLIPFSDSLEIYCEGIIWHDH